MGMKITQPKPKSKQNKMIIAYLKALRPKQWTKNLLVFAAPLFAFSINLSSFFGSIIALVLFCLTSSSFYLFNDIKDVESDRHHPVKCNRPIAAGLVNIKVALIMAIVLLISTVTIGWLINKKLGMTLLSYAILQVCYNLKLKKTPILDVIAIAAGFVLRAYAGAAATNLLVSPWFLLCTAMLALFLGIEKRKAELRLSQEKGTKTRSVLKHYSLPLLTRMESTVTTGAFMSYALWSAGPVVKGATTPWMMLTLPFVLYGIFRYQLLSDWQEFTSESQVNSKNTGMTERPDEVLLSDKGILGTVIGWILTSFIILYLQKQGLIN